jgi:predicted permease
VSRAFYRTLLLAYPPGFRAVHGDDATDVFADLAHAARLRGGPRLLGLWLRTIPAVVRGGISERRELRGSPPGRTPSPWRPDMLTNELKQSVRALARRPAFALTAVLTLALGIGATTAVFSVVDAVLLSPLPYEDPDALVELRHVVPELATGEWGLSQAGYFYFREHAETLQDIAAYRGGSMVRTGDGPPQRLQSFGVTASLLSTLGVTPELGRPFTAADDTPGAPPVAILSHGLWTRSFGADPGVIGSSVLLGGTAYEIIGVMPESFRYPSASTDVWVPMRLDPDARPVNSHIFAAVARMSPGATVETVRSELTGLIGRFPEEMPTAYGNGFIERSGFRPVVRSLLEETVGGVRAILWIVLGAAALVLIIACANVANLMMLRSEGRRRELAVRSALGASRGALLRFSLSEAAIVSLAGGAIGIVLAWAGVRLLVLAAPPGLRRVEEIAMRPLAAVTAVAIAVVVALVLGVASSMRGGVGVAEQLKSGGRAGSADRRRARARGAFVVTQVAMAVLLVAGSGLLLRSILKLRGVDPGFSPDNVLTVRLALSPAKYPDDGQAMGFFEQVTERIGSLSGVRAAGIVDGLPLGSRASDNANGFADLPDGSEQTLLFDTKFAGPGYLEAMGLRLIEGRTFERRDMESGTLGAVVTRSLAEQLWPDGSALGKRARPLMTDYPWHTIVGVVEDVRTEFLDRAPEPTIYFPYADVRWGRSFYLAIRAEGPPGELLPAVRDQVWALDPDVPMGTVATMEDLIGEQFATTSFTLTLVGAAAAMALFLCAVGIYGVIGYAVRQRHFEIGVRMALGARAAQVAGMVIGQTLVLASAGILIGLGLALAGMGLLESLLFEVTPTDPLTLGAVALGLALVAALAGALPARRATRVDALIALQGE